MELIMDYREGNLIIDEISGGLYLVSFKTLYNLVLIEFQRDIKERRPYSDWQSNLPLFTWKNYNLTNKDDINELNNKFNITLDPKRISKDYPNVYGVEIGSVVEFDYKQMMLIGQTERKVLNFSLIRPVLFDFNKAKEKYIVADRLSKLNDLQSEFDSNWADYFVTPFASEENINWVVVKDRLPFEEVISKEFIINEFVHTPTDKITLNDFMEVINTKKLNKIADENIKNEIINLIKQTLVLAKENQTIGIKGEPTKPKKKEAKKEDEVRFNVEFTYKLNPSDKDVLSVEEYVYGIDEQDALAKAPNYFYDIYEGLNYDLISVSLMDKEEPIIDVVDENAGKTLYKINVVVSAMEKDGGTKYPKVYDVYADSETEALEKIRQDFKDDEDFRLGDLYIDYAEVVEVIPPSKQKEAVVDNSIEETQDVEDLLKLMGME
jgi:hypothetical protein